MKKGTKSSSTKGSKAKKGDKFVCNECGLVISVDKACGCEDECYSFVCCDTPMEHKKK